jgi:hypothetical protein
MARTRDELLEMLDELIRPSDPILVYGRQQLYVMHFRSRCSTTICDILK